MNEKMYNFHADVIEMLPFSRKCSYSLLIANATLTNY